ncbi:hypothetical protein [Natrinema gelatinilyticum]|uniref:hypothetical protein n=1 Tax=Natrinema gelatinilyticum TaxID=2961571 RepID=UPI0020C1FA4C|nr:hypothetical protein [Natrinema gelatinilyticum]
MEVLYRVARETVVIDVDPWRGPFAEYDKYGAALNLASDDMIRGCTSTDFGAVNEHWQITRG